MSPAPWKEDRWEKLGPGRYRRRTGGGAVVVEAASSEPVSNDEVDATAAAVKLASETGVDLGSISGSGAGGRITVGDVKAAAN